MGNTLFWKDAWLRKDPLCIMFPVSFDLRKEMDATV
jgi:hypothetical protein